MTGDTQTADNENDPKRLTIDQAVEILIDRQKQGDHLFLYSPNGLRFLHLRFSEYPNDTGAHIKLMFKRSPEMKPYYPKIRAWFADNDLEWKDVTVDDVRYMAALLPLETSPIVDYVKSVQQNIFGFKDYGINAINSDLSNTLIGFGKNGVLFILAAFTAIIAMVSFFIFQATRVFDLGPPSLNALDKTEIILFNLFFLSMFYISKAGAKLRKLNKSTPNSKAQGQKRIWLKRSLVIAAISTMFFTY